MSPRRILSLVLALSLALVLTDGRAVSEESRPKRQASSRCTGGLEHMDMGEIIIGGNSNYQNEEDCCFILDPVLIPGPFEIELQFETFDIEFENNCGYDYLSYNTSYGVYEKDCGTKTDYQRTFRSEGRFQMCFHSDGSEVGRGVHLIYFMYPAFDDNMDMTTTLPPATMPTTLPPTTMPTTLPPTTMPTTLPPTTVPTTLPPATTHIDMVLTTVPSNSSSRNTSCDLVLTGSHGSFTSPGFNQSYPNRKDCVTTIQGPRTEYTLEITFRAFDIEDANNCQYDYLQLIWSTNRTQKACGHQWRNQTLEFDIDGGNVTAVFHSDGSVTGGGFHASYRIIPRGVPRNTTDCVYNAHGMNGMIQSPPGTGADYLLHLNCSYIFHVPSHHVLHLNFSIFDLEGGSGCPFDFVQINGGQKWCGNVMNETRVHHTGRVNLVFRTDGSVSRRGFVAHYHIRAENGTHPTPPANVTIIPMNTTYLPINTTYLPINTTYLPINTTYLPINTTYLPINTTYLPVNTTHVPTTLPTQNVTVSPNGTSCNYYSESLTGQFTLQTDHEGFYGNNEFCNIDLHSPALPHVTTINFTRFDVEYHRNCNYDVLEVVLGTSIVDRLCGNNRDSFTRQYSTAQSDLRMTFASDNSVRGHGFSFSYKTDISYCNATINATSGAFSSPPGGYYNNMRCTYTIQTPTPVEIHLSFSEFDVEYSSTCSYDALTIGEERLCGSSVQSKTYESDGTFVMTFTTDHSVTEKGFHVSFTSTPIN